MKKSRAANVQNLPEGVEHSPFRLKLLGILMVFTAFLLPLKLGTLASMTEAAGFFPADWLDYWHITWPAHAFGIISGILLLLTSILTGGACGKRLPALFAGLWSIGMLLAVLPGVFAPGREINFAEAEFSNFAGIAAWTLAVWHLHCAAPSWTKRMAAAFMLGVLITAVNGYYQYFFGFAEMKAFAEAQTAAGIQIPEALLLKLTDTRITSFMASPNALAGAVLITLPLVFYFGGKWGKLFEPVKVSVPLFRACGLIVLGGALILCRSRSILITLTFAGALAAFSAPFIKRKFKIFAAVAVAVLLLGGAGFALKYGRGFGSITERVDYLRTSAVLVWEHPICGAGWGGFFFRHMQMKFSSTDEAARDPHNMVAAFAGQAGAASGLLALAALLLPLVMLWKERFAGNWRCTIFWSGVLFTLHILMDCDMHIPAIMAGMITLYLSASEINDKLLNRYGRAGVILLSITIAATAIWSNYKTLYGEYKLAEFMEFLNPSSEESRERMSGMPIGKFETAALEARPHLALIWELGGDWFMTSDLELAEYYYRRALDLEPRRPGIYRRLARLACLKGDYEIGRDYLKKAQELFPRNQKYSIEYPENSIMFTPQFKLNSGGY